MRILEPNHLATLEHCTAFEAIEITLEDETVLRFAVCDVAFDDKVFLGRLTLKSALRMTLATGSDNVDLELDNTNLELGQGLIHSPDALDNNQTIFGVYFKNNETGEEWFDEKLPGELVSGVIDGDKVSCTFLSEIDATKGEGRLISEVFPNARLANEATPVDAPIYLGVGGGGGGYIDDPRQKQYSPIYQDWQYDRYALPEFQLM